MRLPRRRPTSLGALCALGLSALLVPAEAGAAAPPRAVPAPSTTATHLAAGRFGPRPGPAAVEVMDLDWLDQDRNRPVPVRIYFPKRGDGPFPVLVFSSGLGAGRGSCEFLGRHLASHGVISVHVQHPGSDARIWQAGGDPREAVKKVFSNQQTGITRLLDLVFVLDQVGALQTTSPVLRGRIDLKQVAVGGSNLGAWTALGAAGLGQAGKDGEESSLPDPRVKAVLLFAPLAPTEPRQRERLRFENIRVPCLHLLGSLDNDDSGDRQAAARRFAFEQIAGADQVLVIFKGDSVRLGGRKPGAFGGENEPALQDHLKTISTAFLEAYLRHDAAAREWLAGGGLAAALGVSGSVETRSPQTGR